MSSADEARQIFCKVMMRFSYYSTDMTFAMESNALPSTDEAKALQPFECLKIDEHMIGHR
jgi:hypothetical protein